MTVLHWIRHGRASALEADYDKLHTIGELQARALGAHLARTAQRFDAVYVGPLKRQLDTERLMREAAGDVGRAWPTPEVIDDLAEGPFEALFKTYARAHAKRDLALQRLVAALRSADDATRDASLDAFIAYVIGAWEREEIQDAALETALAFEARVARALEHIARREGRGREVAVVTSNGVIGNVVARTRGFVAASAGAHRRVHNSSVSRVEIVEGGYELRAHDVTLHIADPAHLTTL